MYRPNDVLIGNQLLSNVFNTQDNAWHDKAMRPIRGFWSMSKVLEIEGFIDETLKLLVDKLDSKFGALGKICPMDDWLGYCKFNPSSQSCRSLSSVGCLQSPGTSPPT